MKTLRMIFYQLLFTFVVVSCHKSLDHSPIICFPEDQSIAEKMILFQKFYNEEKIDSLISLIHIEDVSEKNEIVQQMRLVRLEHHDIIYMLPTKQDAQLRSYETEMENGVVEFTFILDENKIIDLQIESINPSDFQNWERNVTTLSLPLQDEWFVFWGGKEIADNYHNAYPSMYGAYDFWIMGPNGKSYKTNGQFNEDYYAFGQNIIAPCDGEIVRVISGIEDNKNMKMNSERPTGNVVIMKTENGEYLLFAHLKYQSIVVEEGQKVSKGDLMAQCGNSGRSTEPHLHFLAQNSPYFIATKGFPAYFGDILVNGKLKKEYIPLKGQKVSND